MSKKGNQKIINKEFNPLILSEILRRHWVAPVLFISFFITAAFFYLRYTKPVYESEGINQIVEEDKVREVFGSDVFGKRKEQSLSKYIELLKHIKQIIFFGLKKNQRIWELGVIYMQI